MGLFDGKAKKESAENEVLQKLSQVPLLDLLIENVLNEEEPWILERQSYYDDGRRVVKIEPDEFEIKWFDSHIEEYIGNDGQLHYNTVEDVHGRVGYSYTKSGYLPLHGYKYDNGNKEVPANRVRYLWASIIRERMMAKMPQCKFGDVNGEAIFSYTVPALSFKDWF